MTPGRSMTPEGKVKAKVKKYLDEIGAYYFMPVQTGYGKTGLDFFVCWPGNSIGYSWFVAIEAKYFGKVPTPKQALVIHQIRKAGGTVYVVDYEVPPLRAAVTGNESWYPTFSKESENLRRNSPGGEE